MGMLSYIHNDFINLNLLEVFFLKYLNMFGLFLALFQKLCFCGETKYEQYTNGL